MADEIKLKAPTVEQQVNVVINGEEKLKSFASTLENISSNKNLQKYWKDQKQLIEDVSSAYGNFTKTASKNNALELMKTTNALKALSDVDISSIIPDFKSFSQALESAKNIAGSLDSAFSVNSFKDAFSSFETLRAYGVDLQELFKHFEFNADVDRLVTDLNNANNSITNLKTKVTQLQDKLEESESGNGIKAIREECESLTSQVETMRREASETFAAFLKLNNIDAGYVDDWGYRISGQEEAERFFRKIEEGSLTAQEAIAEFKRRYSYLLEDNASFDTSQLQDFSNRLEVVSKQITEVSNKLDDISSKGVKVSDFGGSGSGSFEELANVVNQIENTNANGGASAIYESLSKILTAIREIGQCDTDNIYHIYATIRNLAQLNDLKINKASLDNLADCLERICNIGNSSTLTNLSMLDLKKFNDLHISKASLNNLAEYLPQIANVDVRTLVELANIDFDKLNSLHIDKDSMKNLFSFVEGLRNATGLTDFTTENKNVESSADSSTSSLNTEAELMQSIATNADKAAKAKKEFVEANKELAKATETSVIALSKENSELGKMGNKSNISSGNTTTPSEVKNNEEVASAIRKKKEELASYELQVEELRYEIEKLSKAETNSAKSGFSSVLSKKQLEAQYDSITNRIFGEYDSKTGKDGSKKWMAFGNLANISENTLNSYRMWQEELQKVGYRLGEIRETSVGLEADILPIDGKAVTNAEEFRRLLSEVSSVPNDNITLLNSQLSELEGKVSSIKAEIKSLESVSTAPIKDTFQRGHSDNSEPAGVTRYQKHGYKARDNGNHDNEVAVADKKKLGEALKGLQNEIIASIDESTQFIKEVTDFYDSKDNLVKTQMKIVDEIGNMSTYTTSYSQGKDGNITAWTSHITTEKILEAKKAEEKIEKDLQKQKDSFNKKNLTAIDLEIQKKEELSKIASNDIKTQMEERQKLVSSMEDEIKSFNERYDALNLKPSDANRSVEYQGALDRYKSAITDLQSYLDELNKTPVISEEQKNHWNELIINVNKASNELKSFSAAEKGSTEGGRWKEIDKISKYLDKNTKISKEARQKLQGYLDLLKSGSAVNIEEIHMQFNKIAEAERRAGREGKSFFDILTDKAVYGAAARLASYYLSFYDFIRYTRNAVTAIRELDTALIDLKKTTAMTSSQLEEFYFDSNDVAKEMGVTTKAIIDQASAWSRLGYNTKEASTEMAKLSSQFASISPGMDLDTSTDGLVSTMKAFDIEVEDVERRIMDNINRIGNTAATSNGEIVDMLTRSSAAMAVANNTLEETIALETAAVEITRNAESTGTAFKTNLCLYVQKCA